MRERNDEWNDVSMRPEGRRARKSRSRIPVRRAKDPNIEWLPEDVLDDFDEEPLDLEEDWEEYFHGEDDPE